MFAGDDQSAKEIPTTELYVNLLAMRDVDNCILL
ncbi:MAG: hypothetical protein JWM08_446 [Candidatus Angelobacter sp.]|nr:hypothetical protein [Candidatus Angelobacter sp.]